jgi:hypothetical protein
LSRFKSLVRAFAPATLLYFPQKAPVYSVARNYRHSTRRDGPQGSHSRAAFKQCHFAHNRAGTYLCDRFAILFNSQYPVEQQKELFAGVLLFDEGFPPPQSPKFGIGSDDHAGEFSFERTFNRTHDDGRVLVPPRAMVSEGTVVPVVVIDYSRLRCEPAVVVVDPVTRKRTCPCELAVRRAVGGNGQSECGPHRGSGHLHVGLFRTCRGVGIPGRPPAVRVKRTEETPTCGSGLRSG